MAYIAGDQTCHSQTLPQEMQAIITDAPVGRRVELSASGGGRDKRINQSLYTKHYRRFNTQSALMFYHQLGGEEEHLRKFGS